MANAIYINKATALVKGTDFDWSLHNTSNGAGQVSSQIDLGVVPRGARIAWSCNVQFKATPTQYAGLELYVAGAPDGDSTQIDGDVGATDSSLGDVDMRRNLLYIGEVISENAAASEPCIRSGIFQWDKRYISFVGYNSSGASINAAAGNFAFTMQVVYPEVQ